jgi:hypothetical protein
MLACRPGLVPALFALSPTDRRGKLPEGMKPWCDKPIGVPGTALKAALEAE